MENNNDGPWAAAVDIGGTKTLVGLVDHTGKVHIQKRFPTITGDGPQRHLNKCIQAIKSCMAESGIGQRQVEGIGITVPGLADSRKGMLIYAPYANWRNVPVAKYVGASFEDVPVHVANDVNACALGELTFGKARNSRNFLWVTISTGIGAGLIIDGKLFEGETGLAGEIGHVVVEWAEGRLCGCGNRGCLEAHASGTAIAAAAKEKCIRDGNGASAASFFQSHELEVTAENVARAAREGELWALDIYRQAGRYLGRAFSYYINILNPGCIIVGGGVGLSLDLLQNGIQEVTGTAVIGEENKAVPVIYTGLGYEAGLIGAASLVLSEDGGLESEV